MHAKRVLSQMSVKNLIVVAIAVTRWRHLYCVGAM